MKKWKIFCSICLLLVGCGAQANSSEPKSPSNDAQIAPAVSPNRSSPEAPSTSTEAQAAPADSPDSSPIGMSSSLPEEEETEPVYIDESRYEGDELAFVRLINRSVQYINEGNEEGYKSLLAGQSPVNAMPKRKVDKVELVGIGEPNGSQIAVGVTYWRGDEEQGRMYVFTKENDEWKVLDID